MNLGNNILRVRKEKKLSQEQLADLVGVTRQTISNWELNETLPDTNQLIKLSKHLNISIDDLVNNDITNIIVDKVSNTEKLAGIIIKILKVIGFCLVGFLLVIVVSFILFNVVKKQPQKSSIKSTTLNCSIENTDYMISFGNNGYFNCSNCNKKMQVYLNDITDWANMDNSIKNVKTYFEENGGVCE